MKRLTLIGAIAAALALVVIVGLAGCGDSDEQRDDGFGHYVGNHPPNVELSATSPEGDATEYDIEFSWTAWDADGVVSYFMYCVDPPGSAGADTLWQMTEARSVRLTFADETYGTGSVEEWWRSQIGGVYHVFVVKAVDDLGAMSTPDYLAFNSATLCPKTYIVSPPPCCACDAYQGGPQAVGLRVTFRWEGEDPDGVVSGEPVGYLYKLVDVTGELNWKNIAGRVYEDHGPWVEVGPGTTLVRLDLDDGRAYGFGVRAIDEAGAIEPVVTLNRNLLWIWARQRSSFPDH